MRVRALVMKNLQAPCFGGTTFHVDNDIETKIKSGTVTIHGRFVVDQSNPHRCTHVFPPPVQQVTPSKSINNPACSYPSGSAHQPLQTFLHAISLPHDAVTFPEDFLRIPLPPSASNVDVISISPSFPKIYEDNRWTPQICRVVNGNALYQNFSSSPLLASKFSHFKPHLVHVNSILDVSTARHSPNSRRLSQIPHPTVAMNKHQSPLDKKYLLSLIKINENILSQQQLLRLQTINEENFNVFDNNLSGGYNHFSGKFYADFSFSNRPPPTKVYVPQYNRKCADLQQSKCDELESQGVLVDPKLYDIPVLHVSPSWIQQKGRAKHKQLQECSLDELRFITAFNTLNDSIRPKPTSSCSANSIFLFLARWKHHVFADLNNSYFQLPVKRALWSYLGVMTPHKGVRVLTRTGQGLLGSDVELEQLMARVLGDEITQGFCMAIRDDIVIGGNSLDEAIENYNLILSKLNKNNLKLSPNKVRVFPGDTEIYGYRVFNGCVKPSEHTISTLGQTKIENLTTVKQVNSWKGLYKTLIGHLPALSNVMSPFDSATGNKNSNEKFPWTPALTSAFNVAMSHLSKINQTYLPKPSEQLILLPDAMSSLPCVGWVLYVQRNGKLLPIVHCTAKLKDYMCRWYPCEKEAVGVVLSLDQCSHWIQESELPTLIGPDCLAVVKAAELIRKGRHSSNPRLQSLLASVNKRNIRFFHNSAKAGRHIVPDHLSRMSDSTCHSKDCAIERFLDDIPVNLEAMSLTLNDPNCTLLSISLEDPLPSPSVIAATATELQDHLLTRSGPIPLGSTNTWRDIQKSDEDCRTVFRLKSLGEEPRKKSTNPFINRIYREAIIHQGLLVVRSIDNKKLKEILRVVVPPSYLDSILTVLHLRLNHPKQSQLKLVFERYFFSPRMDAGLTNLYSACHVCASLQKFPKQLETFNPSLQPNHPGLAMNVDVLRRAGQIILVNVDVFSFYVTACFVSSERAEDLCTAIIQVVTPIRRSGSLLIRTDRAPGFVKLANSSQTSLRELGISIELGNEANKNSNCSVDKAIRELEDELKKVSPTGSKITTAELAQSVLTLNNKIRNRNLSAAEIHFSRDSHDNSNLVLDDLSLGKQQMALRTENHIRLAKSRTPKAISNPLPEVERGDIVFVRDDDSKHTSLDPHIVIDTDDPSKSLLKKALYSNPVSRKPLSLSTRSRLVENKFILKPTPFSLPRTPLAESPDPIVPNVVTQLVSSTSKPTVSWSPLDDELELDLIPIEADVSRTNPDISVYTPERDHPHLPVDTPPEVYPHQLDFDHPESSSDQSHNADDEDSESDSSNSPVLLFDGDDHIEIPERLDQSRKPKKGDKISYFDTNTNTWINAFITHDLTRRYRHYFNIVTENGRRDGLYLAPDTRWTLLQDESPPEENRNYGFNISSLEPSPTSFLHLRPRHLSFSRSVDNLHVQSSPTIHDNLDSDSLPSLEWDYAASNDSPSYFPDLPLDRVLNLDNVLPLSLTYHRSTSVDLLQPQNLDQRLPLTSTPVSPRSRVSNPRRSLPLERSRGRSLIPTIFRKFNPFKKQA